MRATNAVARLKRKRRILKATKGMWGRRHNLRRLGIEAVMKQNQYAFVGRKRRKREFRSLWTIRINAACRALGLNYSRFMAGLTKAGIAIDRKQLSELAVKEPKAFAGLVEQAKAALPPALLPKAKAAAK